MQRRRDLQQGIAVSLQPGAGRDQGEQAGIHATRCAQRRQRQALHPGDRVDKPFARGRLGGQVRAQGLHHSGRTRGQLLDRLRHGRIDPHGVGQVHQGGVLDVEPVGVG